MMPWELLSQRDIGVLFFINFTTGIAIFAVLYFLDLYFVFVEGQDSITKLVLPYYFIYRV